MIILGLLNKSNIAKIKKEIRLSTKFGIEDDVYVMHENKIHKGKVVRIDCILQKTTPKNTILYTLDLPNVSNPVQLPEKLCFESKEKLIDSL